MSTMRDRMIVGIAAVSAVIFVIYYLYRGSFECKICGWVVPLEALMVVSVVALAVGATSIYALVRRIEHRLVIKDIINLWWVNLRVLFGFIWFSAGIVRAAAVLSGVGWNDEFLQKVVYFASGNPHPWYKAFLMDTVIPNAELFSSLIAFAEVFAGLLLLLGLMTRLGAFIAAFMSIQFFLATGWMGVPMFTENVLMAAYELLLLWVSAGRWLGVDQLLARRYPKSFLW